MTGRKHTLETKIKLSKKRMGNKNPAYKNGGSLGYIYYKGLFHRWLREQIKNRDGNKCVICGDGKKELHVHHMNGDKIDNRRENLITLCESCHSKLHHGGLEPLI